MNGPAGKAAEANLVFFEPKSAYYEFQNAVLQKPLNSVVVYRPC